MPRTKSPLEDKRILVVEDVYFIADDVRASIEKAGGIVVGPVATVGDAIRLIEHESPEIGVLDVNLGFEMSFPVAEALMARAIPFLFATGYDDWALPEAWEHVPRVGKPYRYDQLIEAIVRLDCAFAA